MTRQPEYLLIKRKTPIDAMYARLFQESRERQHEMVCRQAAGVGFDLPWGGPKPVPRPNEPLSQRGRLPVGPVDGLMTWSETPQGAPTFADVAGETPNMAIGMVVGVPAGTVWRVRQCLIEPSKENKAKLAAAFGLSPQDIRWPEHIRVRKTGAA